jgi:hypothetical protein
MLCDFFRINMPYGIDKDESVKWMAFNREYRPIGFYSGERFDDHSLPNYVKYHGLTEVKLLQLADNEEHNLKRDDHGNICKVFFYNDETNPASYHPDQNWKLYLEKLKILAQLKVDDPPNDGKCTLLIK